MVLKVSGDTGDIIYSLLYCKEAGFNKLILDPTGGQTYKYGDVKNHKGKFNKDLADFLYPFLASQIETEWDEGQPYDLWFNEWKVGTEDTNITRFHARKFDLDWQELKCGWLKPYSDNKVNRLIVGRTPRYNSGSLEHYHKFINEFRDIHGSEILFLGLKEEYDEFPIKADFIQVKDALEMAQLVSESTHFIGNGSVVAAMALGFGLDCEYEWCHGVAHYEFNDHRFNPFNR